MLRSRDFRFCGKDKLVEGDCSNEKLLVLIRSQVRQARSKPCRQEDGRKEVGRHTDKDRHGHWPDRQADRHADSQSDRHTNRAEIKVPFVQFRKIKIAKFRQRRKDRQFFWLEKFSLCEKIFFLAIFLAATVQTFPFSGKCPRILYKLNYFHESYLCIYVV